MAKQLKISIKNTQLAKKVGLDKIKDKLAEKKDQTKKAEKPAPPEAAAPEGEEKAGEAPRRIRAKSKSRFAPQEEQVVETPPAAEEEVAIVEEPEVPEAPKARNVLLEEVVEEVVEVPPPPPPPPPKAEVKPVEKKEPPRTAPAKPAYEKLGPTGRHISEFRVPTKEKPPEPAAAAAAEKKDKPKKEEPKAEAAAPKDLRKPQKRVREFKDLKPAKAEGRPFTARDRAGLTEGDEERWRKRRQHKPVMKEREEVIIRPTELSIRLPIMVKDLAAQMKLKSSELVQKLFMQGMTYTLNDILDDETIVQFLGEELGCTITIDRTEEDRIQITQQSVQAEISATDTEKLVIRPPVVTFMGHVDHGKTSLIDAIRTTNRVAGEAGAITQHIGAFRCSTRVGDITILDTPGHEAFSAMRARGAQTTDIVVLVIAGDEGMREQTKEALQQAKEAKVTIVVAINKADKPNFNAENVYRELSEVELLPEAWGGQTITINTSATTGKGIPELLEMLALQAEVLELKANPAARARGVVIESELHKGMGNVATVLVQNGTLRLGDALVFERIWGRVKTMRDEAGNILQEAGPSTPVEITGLSGLPAAGDPLIVVANEREARSIAEARAHGMEQKALMARKTTTLESLMQQKEGKAKKILKLILRADVQGSVEALKNSIEKIKSQKVAVDVVFTGVGEISESDIQLAQSTGAVVIGFHTGIESHATGIIKELGITVRLFDVIYHAVDEVKLLMKGLLDKISEEKELGAALVQATFKASQLGVIAGCIVTEGAIIRSNMIRVVRDGKAIWKGKIASLKRVKEDVKEVKKGLECGILLEGYNEVKPGDILQAYEIIYITQEI